MKRGRETLLVRAIISLLHRLGVPAWRCNTGVAKHTDQHGKTTFVRYGLVGMGDIQGVIPPSGRMLVIEAKVGDNPLSKDQRRVLADLKDAGALALVVRDSTDGLSDVIREAMEEARRRTV